jgi:hypothetical protein
MRGKLLFTAAVLILGFAVVVSLDSPGEAEDNNDQRISDLETRVAALEASVFGATPEAGSSDGNRNSSSSSSSSTTTTENGSNSFTATYSGTGDREIELEIDDAGTYQMTATTTSAFTAVLENEDDEPVSGFSVETDGAQTVTVSADLEPGTYLLRVSAPESWSVSIVSLGSQ